MITTSSKDILLIDDDNRNIFALKAVLKSKGFNCLTATSAEDGFKELSRQNNIGVVLLDMMMPEMDGYEAIHFIRQDLKRTIPIIAVTAQAMHGDKEKCLAAGADAYLPKPVDVDQLLLLLQRYLK
jgi:two-component system, cell cycle response regulator DivK